MVDRAVGVSGAGELASALERLRSLPSTTSPSVHLAQAIDAACGRAALTLQQAERAVLLRVAEWFARRGQVDDFPAVNVGRVSPADRAREQEIETVAVGGGSVQNQMTTVTHVRPERLARLHIALAGTRLLSALGWPPGEFADVGTLHWFAWALVDHIQELIFLSVFDGSWKNYMQDFIDKLIWGLDCLYSNTDGYPPAGMRDTAGFTNFILEHQWPADVLYSSYPTETVMNLIRDRRIASGVPKGTDVEALDEWLAVL